MKAEKYIERTIRDYEIADTCNLCCIGCKKYKSVKEMKTKCEARKARSRLMDRYIRGAKKEYGEER